MEYGFTIPTRVAWDGVGDVVRYATVAEELGFKHMAVGYHDAGVSPTYVADPEWGSDWPGLRMPAYHGSELWPEPFLLFAHLSALTELGFLTRVLPTPQRSAVALAKAAAELWFLARSRFRLGVGIGWNRAEFGFVRGSDVGWTRRGTILEEQIEVMRLLWSSDDVHYHGEFHTLDGCQIAPRPSEPVPIWIGSATAPRALDRVARLADGWMPMVELGDELSAAVVEVRRLAERHGRDPDGLGIQGRLFVRDEGLVRLEGKAAQWREHGAAYCVIEPLSDGRFPEDHLRLLEEAATRLL